MKLSFIFNGDARLCLTPENEDDKKLLDLAFNGKTVKSIKDADGCLVLLLSRSAMAQSEEAKGGEAK